MNKHGQAIWVFITSCLLWCLWCFAWVKSPYHTGIGQGIDPFQYIWNADVFAEAVKQGRNPFFTHRFLYPEGLSLVMHTYTPIIGMVNVFFGAPYLSVGLCLMFSFAFSAMGTWYLARKLGLPAHWSWILAFLFAFSPYKTAHLTEHHHLMLTGHIPFYMIALMKFYDDPGFHSRIKHLGVLIILLLVSFLSDYYTTFFLLLFSVVYVILKSISIRPKWIWMGMIFLTLTSHFLVTHFRSLKVDDKGGFYNTPDISALIIPPPNSAIYGSEWFQKFEHLAGFKGQTEQIVFLSFSLIALLVIRMLKQRTITSMQSWVWWMVLFFFLLTFPKIKWAEHPILYGPLSWLHQIPFLNNFRNPGRYFSMVYLFLPLALMLDFNNKYSRSLWINALFIGILIEYIPKKAPVFSTKEVPEWVIDLKENKDIKNIVFVPDGVRDGFKEVGHFESDHLLWSVHHGKNIPGAYISRIPEEKFEFYRNQRVLMWLSDSLLNMNSPSREEISVFMRFYQPNLLIYDKDCQFIPKPDQIEFVFRDFIRKKESRPGYILYYF